MRFVRLGFIVVIIAAILLVPSQAVLAAVVTPNDSQAIYGDWPLYSDATAACTPSSSSSASQSSNGITTMDLSYKDGSRGDRPVGATVRLPDDSNPHPLVMFAPGRDVDSKVGGLYTRYLDAIAKQGFVVVGANFSDNHSAGAVAADSQDMKFLLDQALSEPKLQGKLNSAAGIALIGHSDGGMIATTVGYGAGGQKDDRITAVIAEDGSNGIASVGPPLLLMHGDQDTSNTGSIQASYQASQAPYTAFALFKGADHYHYITGAARGDNITSYDKYHPAVDAVTTAFLKRMLNKDTSNDTSLTQVVAGYSDQITFTQKGNDTVTGGASTPASTSSPGNNSCQCPSTGSTVLTGSDNAQKAFNFFLQDSHGFSVAQVAGIVGNFMTESGANLDTKADNGSHHGIAQWDTSPGGRYEHLKTFVASKNPPLDPESLDGQLQFVIEELNTNYKQAAEDLKQQTTPDAAAASWEKFYEGAVGQQTDKRQSYARDLMTKYGSSSTDANTSNTSTSVTCSADSSGQVVGGFSLPLDKKWYTEHKDWFTKPHHDYPAADIPVPDGTPVYSMTAGVVLSAPNEGGYGKGVTIKLADGTLIDYGHGGDGGTIQGAKVGDTVNPGQLIMHSNHTGDVQPPGPAGAHLHVDIKIAGSRHCPQTLFVAIAENQPIPALSSLPTTGCFY